MILSPLRGALLCASLLLGSTVTAQAQLQSDAACAFSAFPLSQNFGSFPSGLGGDSVRCGAIRMQGAINALATQVSAAAPLSSPAFTGVMSATQGALVNGAAIPGTLGGLQPLVGMGANLTGNPFSASLAPPAGAVGPSGQPLAGIYSNVISNNGHASTRNGNVSAYRAAILGQITAYPNSADVFGMDVQVNHDQSAPADISVIGIEVDMAKNGSRDCTSIGGPVYCAGFLMTTSTDGASLWGPAFLIEGAANSFHYGYTVNGNGVKDAAFMDASNAITSLNIAGNHTTGINFSGSFATQQIAGKGWAVDPSGGLSAAAVTTPVMVSTGRTQIAAGAPASSSTACVAGEIKVSADNYIYFCTRANTWLRVQGSAF